MSTSNETSKIMDEYKKVIEGARAAKELRLRRIAAIPVLLLPFALIACVWLSLAFPGCEGHFVLTAFVLVVSGFFCAVFATKDFTSLPIE